MKYTFLKCLIFFHCASSSTMDNVNSEQKEFERIIKEMEFLKITDPYQYHQCKNQTEKIFNGVYGEQEEEA